MKITVTRSGGFAGITMPPKSLETDDKDVMSLAEAVASELDHIGNHVTPDGMTYEIFIEDEGHTPRAISITKGEPTNAQQKLIDLVIKG